MTDSLRRRRIWFFSSASIDTAAALASSPLDDDVCALGWLIFEARHLCEDAPPEESADDAPAVSAPGGST